MSRAPANATSTSLPEAASLPVSKEEVRRELHGVLVHGLTPSPRLGALVALLHAIRGVRKVVDPREAGVGRRDLDLRAKVVAEGSWGSRAVRKAIDEMQAAVMVTVAAGAAAASGGS